MASTETRGRSEDEVESSHSATWPFPERATGGADVSTDEREPPSQEKVRAFLEPERERATVRIEMLDDERSRAAALIARNGWSEDEGLHIIFSRGLVELERETTGGVEFEGKRLIDMKTPEERERFLLGRLDQLESKYSVMKFASFNALRDTETLRMNVTGLSIEYQALSEQNKYLRHREDELRATIAELEARVRTERPAPRRTRWQAIRLLLRELFR